MTSRFEVAAATLPGVQILTRTRVGDDRGHLERLFDAHELSPFLAGEQVVQVNRTMTVHAGTVRGLHLQLPPHAETKIVSCLRGRVFDVAVDLRSTSPTYRQWFGCELSAQNGRALLIPRGCAHGVQTLDDESEVLYVHTAPYVAASEAGLNPLDEMLAIDWPMPVSNISRRDAAECRDAASFAGVEW